MLEQTLVLNPCVCARKNWYFEEYFQRNKKNNKERQQIYNFQFELLPKKGNGGGSCFTESWLGSMDDFRAYTHLFENVDISKFEIFQRFETIPGNWVKFGFRSSSSVWSRKFLVAWWTSCLLYKFPAEARLTVYRRLAIILTHSSNSRALPPRRSVILDVNILIWMLLCI